MFETHPLFELPDEDTVIWRYMDFTKFVSLLHNKVLFFARGDKFEDLYEGVYSEPSKRALEKEYRDWLPDQDPNEINAVLKENQGFTDWLKQSVAINCWHTNEYESAAMWRLYLKSNEGIAIRSTVSRLRDSLQSDDESLTLHVGNVRYIDFKTEMIPVPPPRDNLLAPFMYKRKSFEHEHELRALVMAEEIPTVNGTSQPFARRTFANAGVCVPVDLHMLTDNIFVAPTSPPWFHTLVVSILAKYGVDSPVTQSDLDHSPIW